MTTPEPLAWGIEPTSISLIADLWNDPDRLIGVTKTDGETSTYVAISPSVERLLGYTQSEILAMRPGDLVANREELVAILGDLGAGKSLRARVALRHKGGWLVTTTVRAQVVAVANRSLVVSISEPIGPT
jgi:PAS domain-containing protein